MISQIGFTTASRSPNLWKYGAQAGLAKNMRSQAGAWEREELRTLNCELFKRGVGNDGKKVSPHLGRRPGVASGAGNLGRGLKPTIFLPSCFNVWTNRKKLFKNKACNLNSLQNRPKSPFILLNNWPRQHMAP
jgi:hypothetical protein